MIGYIVVYLILLLSTIIGTLLFYKTNGKKAAIMIFIYDLLIITAYTVLIIILRYKN